MTKIEEKAREFAKTSFRRPYSETPEEEIIIIEPDKYDGFIGGYRQAKQDILESLRNQITKWLPESETEESDYGQAVAFRSVLRLFDTIEETYD